MNDSNKEKNNASFSAIFMYIIGAIVLLFVVPYFLPDNCSSAISLKDATIWNKNWTDWAKFIGITLLIPLGVSVNRLIIGHNSGKNTWYDSLIMALLAINLIRVHFRAIEHDFTILKSIAEPWSSHGVHGTARIVPSMTPIVMPVRRSNMQYLLIISHDDL